MYVKNPFLHERRKVKAATRAYLQIKQPTHKITLIAFVIVVYRQFWVLAFFLRISCAVLRFSSCDFTEETQSLVGTSVCGESGPWGTIQNRFLCFLSGSVRIVISCVVCSFFVFFLFVPLNEGCCN